MTITAGEIETMFYKCRSITEVASHFNMTVDDVRTVLTLPNELRNEFVKAFVNQKAVHQ